MNIFLNKFMNKSILLICFTILASGAASPFIPPRNGKSLIRVAYQGVPGAYSDKSSRGLLGDNVVTVGYPNFEACFRAVAERECDYACLPIENSLGGSIHDNYDLMLRYDLTILAEHEFRVHHCFLVKEGVKKKDIKFAISHPQALAQVDGFLRANGIEKVPVFDTAGAAKRLASGKNLPEGCTPQNTAAIASDLAGKTYGLCALEKCIEDDDSNFTRFLLLGRIGISQSIPKTTASKTSIVFTLPNTPGALYKALACFSLREIDCSKIESRPTSASLLTYLKFQMRRNHNSQGNLPRFRYCFYLDFLANEMDEGAQNALHHLREQSDFCRVLGCYPTKSTLVGHVKDSIENLNQVEMDSLPAKRSITSSDEQDETISKKQLKIGVIGFGEFGKATSKKMIEMGHKVSCLDVTDKSKDANELGIEFYPSYLMQKFLKNVDVLLLSVPMINIQDLVSQLPTDLLHNKLIVEICPLSTYPKSVLLEHLPSDADILSTNALFGADSVTDSSWDGLPFLFEKVRIGNKMRCDNFLNIFIKARCRMVEMKAEESDSYCANSQFVMHLVGRLLDRQGILPPSPVASKEYGALLNVVEKAKGRNFDFFYGLYEFNLEAEEVLDKMRDNLSFVQKGLAAKGAYLAAKKELKNEHRENLMEECKLLMREVAKGVKDGEIKVDMKKDNKNNGDANVDTKKANKNPE